MKEVTVAETIEDLTEEEEEEIFKNVWNETHHFKLTLANGEILDLIDLNFYTDLLGKYSEMKAENEKLKKENEMLKEENEAIKKQLNYLRSGEYYNQLKFERNMLQDIVDNGAVSQEDKMYIDCTHRNTELVEENSQLKEELEKNEKMKQEAIELLKEFLCSEYYCSQGKELYDFCSDLGKILGMIKE